MRAFVTGGSGFLGRHLLATLHDRGDTAAALARSAAAADVVARHGAVPVVAGLSDVAALAAAMTSTSTHTGAASGSGGEARVTGPVDVVFHLAAKADMWGRPRDFDQVNVEGTRAVLTAARQAGVRRFVLVSSEQAILGAHPLVHAPETTPYAARPLNDYARTKIEAERLVLAANDADLATVVVRPRFLWGPGDTTILPGLAASVRAGSFAWIGDGRFPFSTTHVANAVAGLLAAAARGTGGEIYHVTDGEPVEFRAFLTALLATIDVNPGDKTVAPWIARASATVLEPTWRLLRRPGQPPLTRAMVRTASAEVTLEDTKARRDLGYTPVVTVPDALAALAAMATPAAATSATTLHAADRVR